MLTKTPAIEIFGFHPSGLSFLSDKRILRNSLKEKIQRVAIAILSWSTGIIAIGMTSFLCPIFVPLTILSFLTLGTIFLYVAQKIYRYVQICQTAGIIFDRRSGLEYKPTEGHCELLPTLHSAETEVWRKRLIASAEHNIVLSGNYCGGNAFLRLLDAIEKRLQQKPNLDVIIISSPKFLEKEHKRKIAILTQNYKISLIESPDIVHISPGVKKTTNHTKVMTVDYGRRFILGDSGVQDLFATSGLDNETYTELLDFKTDALPPLSNTLKKDYDLITEILPKAFRSGDFVGESTVGKKTIGSQIYSQALLLAYRWEEYGKQLAGSTPSALTAKNLGLLTGTSAPYLPRDSLVVRMLKTALPNHFNSPSLPQFAKDVRKTDAILKILAQGPQNSHSSFAKQIIKEFSRARKRIVINHMYFHPNQTVFDSLVSAANRGVKITLITNGLHKSSPASHHFFAKRNRFNFNALVQKVQKSKRANIEVYEFVQERKGSHKKIILCDDTVIAGSSNLGLKSLSYVCDDEINFVAKSSKLAFEIWKICQKDMKYSRKVLDFSQSFKGTIHAAFQRALAPFID